MMGRGRWMCLSLALVAGGCAADRKKTPATAPVAAATQPSNDPSFWRLEQIGEAPVLVKPAATRPTTQPTLAAIHLYAQARAAQIEGNRVKAARLLEEALKEDPGSFDLHYSLGMVLLSNSGGNERALAALEKAQAINADHLGLQTHLGRIYFSRGNHPRAIHHLRLAMQTSDYAQQAEGATVVDFFLARALQQKGYDLAALERYEKLVERAPRLRARNNPELYFLLRQPDTLLLVMGQLNEKLGRLDSALQCYESAAEAEPNNLEYGARLTRVLLKLKRHEQAKSKAAELLVGHRASREAVELFKQVYEQAGQSQMIAGELQKILQKRPGDRFVIFALADVLKESGKGQEAEALLAEAVRTSGHEPAIVARLFDLHLERGKGEAAGLLVIETLAKRPDSVNSMQDLWTKLVGGSGKQRLRLAEAQKIEVAAEAQASKLYWVWMTAQWNRRAALARATLEKAILIDPPFAPAYRQYMREVLNRADLDAEQKLREARHAIGRVNAVGESHRALNMELAAMLSLHEGNPDAAVRQLQTAVSLGGRDPEPMMSLVSAQLASKREAQAEQTLWRVLGDHPTYEPAYLALLQQYIAKEDPRRAVDVLQKWLAAAPGSTQARLWQIRLLMTAENSQSAETALLSVFRDDPEDVTVVAMMQRFYGDAKREEEFVKLLEEQRRKTPENRIIVMTLLEHYKGKRQLLDAMRILDEMRKAVAGDAESMYSLAHLYEQINHSSVTEAVLQEVLKVDPQHAPANNDLGYMWADAGRNLGQAEEMIRQAVSLEPGNSAYLDSLGWVLYKRGKFEEARRYLKEATGAGSEPDPIVLDHYADVLYRLKEQAEAARIWKQSLDGLEEIPDGRDDLVKLRIQLRQKLRQHAAGEEAAVAPIVAEAATGTATRIDQKQP